MKLRDYLPALRFGAKIMPEDIAGEPEMLLFIVLI